MRSLIEKALETKTVRVHSISLKSFIALTDLGYTVIIVPGGQNEYLHCDSNDPTHTAIRKHHLRLLKPTKPE
jgi:hypothetical protein